MLRFAMFLTLLLPFGAAQGRLIEPFQVESKFLPAPRTVRVYLPPSYDKEPSRRFPVLYLHDGQNVFSSAGPYAAFGWGPWDLDKSVDRLVSEGKMQEIIMVAIDNSPRRYIEYRGPSLKEKDTSPDFGPLPQTAPGDDSAFNQYTRFLIEELKPRIDREYRTQADAAHTGVMGSSMGGICSLVLAWEHPDIFGMAASLSGAYQVERRNLIDSVLKKYSDPKKPFRIYLDSGVTDFMGGDDGRKYTDQVVAELKRIGWKPGTDLEHYVDEKPLTDEELEKVGLRSDKRPEAKRSQHNEFYWKLRAWRPLTFMFPKK